MSIRFNFWLCAFFAVLNLYSFYAAGSVFSLVVGLFCGWSAYRMRHYA